VPASLVIVSSHLPQADTGVFQSEDVRKAFMPPSPTCDMKLVRARTRDPAGTFVVTMRDANPRGGDHLPGSVWGTARWRRSCSFRPLSMASPRDMWKHPWHAQGARPQGPRPGRFRGAACCLLGIRRGAVLGPRPGYLVPRPQTPSRSRGATPAVHANSWYSTTPREIKSFRGY
jgi:hypothetical protein